MVRLRNQSINIVCAKQGPCATWHDPHVRFNHDCAHECCCKRGRILQHLAKCPIFKVTPCMGHRSGLLRQEWIIAGMQVEFKGEIRYRERCEMADMHLRP